MGLAIRALLLRFFFLFYQGYFYPSMSGGNLFLTREATQANTRLSIQIATAYQLVAMIALWKLCQAGLAEPSNLRSPKKFSTVDLAVPRSLYEYQ